MRSRMLLWPLLGFAATTAAVSNRRRRTTSQCGKGREPAAGATYSLKISDVVDRPSLRDVAQTKRSADRNASSTAFTPQDPISDPRHEYVSADITDLDEVMAVMKGTDLAIICSVVR